MIDYNLWSTNFIFRHFLVPCYKFGVIYQKLNQTTEEELFSNNSTCSAMDTFLAMIGEKIDLKGHTGFSGGLDTKHGQTGQYSFYTQHRGKEVMFHVSTLLPGSEKDSQQVERKRHIGNDIVSIVFQEQQTPFNPEIITSHFLHAYIVVHPEPGGGERFRVSVTARTDVPQFGQSLPSPPVFQRGPQFREWILDKLISAETASYSSEKFSKMKMRTQAALLTNLTKDLKAKTRNFLRGDSDPLDTTKASRYNLLDTVKSIISKGKTSHTRYITDDEPKMQMFKSKSLYFPTSLMKLDVRNSSDTKKGTWYESRQGRSKSLNVARNRDKTDLN